MMPSRAPGTGRTSGFAGAASGNAAGASIALTFGESTEGNARPGGAPRAWPREGKTAPEADSRTGIEVRPWPPGSAAAGARRDDSIETSVWPAADCSTGMADAKPQSKGHTPRSLKKKDSWLRNSFCPRMCWLWALAGSAELFVYFCVLRVCSLMYIIKSVCMLPSASAA
jgi:hypothetical protein